MTKMINRVIAIALGLGCLISVASGQTLTLIGDECTVLESGDLGSGTVIGQVCTRIENGNIFFDIQTNEGYLLEDTHICNLPYTSPSGLDAPSYTIEIPEEDSLELVCGFDETEYLVAGHATTYSVDGGGSRQENFLSYFQVPIECDTVVLPGTPEWGWTTPPDSECETVFGYIQNNNYCFPNRLNNDENNCATCFKHMQGEDGFGRFQQWGWVLGGFEKSNDYYRMTGQPQRSYDGELWAHSHDCDTNLGELIGTFEIDYRAKRGKVVVSMATFPGWVLKETHVHVSNDEADYMPKDDMGQETILPRFYTAKHELINGGEGTTLDEYVIPSKGTAYFIVHAVACLA